MSSKCPKCGDGNIQLNVMERIKRGPYHYACFVCPSCGNKSRKIKVKPANDIAQKISDGSVLEA